MRVRDVAALEESFDRQAAACTEMGAPFTARRCRPLGERLDDASALGRSAIGRPLATQRRK